MKEAITLEELCGPGPARSLAESKIPSFRDVYNEYTVPMEERDMSECTVCWCGEDAVREVRREDDEEGSAARSYCERHAREQEVYGRVVPDLNRVRTDKLRLRGVQVLITVWEHDTVGPIVLQEAVRDPVLLGRVSCALTAAQYNVAELTITSRCIVVRIDMRETWTDVDLERMQRRFQVAACGAIRCVNCPRVGCHGCQGEQANVSEPVQS